MNGANGAYVNDDAINSFIGRIGINIGRKTTDGNVYAPVTGVVTTVFPTKHAYGLLTDDGLEVLVHIGLDTVDLEGKPFEAKVSDGQRVQAGDLLAVVDFDAVKAAGKETSVIVVFTNVANIKSVTLEKTGKLAAKTAVAKVEL